VGRASLAGRLQATTFMGASFMGASTGLARARRSLAGCRFRARPTRPAEWLDRSVAWQRQLPVQVRRRRIDSRAPGRVWQLRATGPVHTSGQPGRCRSCEPKLVSAEATAAARRRGQRSAVRRSAVPRSLSAGRSSDSGPAVQRLAGGWLSFPAESGQLSAGRSRPPSARKAAQRCTACRG